MSPIPSLESMEFLDQIFALGFLLLRLGQEDGGEKDGGFRAGSLLEHHDGPSRSLEGLEEGTPAATASRKGEAVAWEVTEP